STSPTLYPDPDDRTELHSPYLLCRAERRGSGQPIADDHEHRDRHAHLDDLLEYGLVEGQRCGLGLRYGHGNPRRHGISNRALAGPSERHAHGHRVWRDEYPAEYSGDLYRHGCADPDDRTELHSPYLLCRAERRGSGQPIADDHEHRDRHAHLDDLLEYGLVEGQRCGLGLRYEHGNPRRHGISDRALAGPSERHAHGHRVW